jgi:hypothetical protein
VAHRRPHHLVDAHRRALARQRGAFRRYVSARAGADLVILHGKEHDNCGNERGENEADSHDSIIGRG